ncbi:hypothetical protein GCM10007875_00450 [Limnobacter litoralis]|uniref:Uncharacterized protein n=1 Tax=Limnobacter litoralis TaxID=481366 RepID=A0ABQ5YPV7_9BURK|nr:hypothetical protein GCM10007875_00450 [Limnobacter litoralis]
MPAPLVGSEAEKVMTKGATAFIENSRKYSHPLRLGGKLSIIHRLKFFFGPIGEYAGLGHQE